jgi:CRP-like cAMP-binding protein
MALNAAHIARAVSDEWSCREPAVAFPGAEGSAIGEHLERLRDCSSRLRFQRNETIFREGDRAAHIYRVVGGCVRLCRHVPDGRRQVADFLFPGDIAGIGELATYPFDAEAANATTVMAYPRDRFEHLAEGTSRFRTDVMAHLAARLRRTHRHLFVLCCQSAKERLASFIVRLSERYDTLYGDSLDLAMGRQDIADHLGLTIETICRAIASLRADGLVDVPNAHQLVLKNIPALRALAEGRGSQ